MRHEIKEQSKDKNNVNSQKTVSKKIETVKNAREKCGREPEAGGRTSRYAGGKEKIQEKNPLENSLKKFRGEKSLGKLSIFS